jgi:hypothetical protein
MATIVVDWRERRRHFGNHSSRIAAQYMELK